MSLPEINTVVVERVFPELDGGRYPVKRVVGERFIVEADIFSHGHEILLARLLYRKRGEQDWQETPMTLVENDRWRGTFDLIENTTYEYTVFAWRDAFLSWRADLAKRIEVGQDVGSELLEGRTLLDATVERVEDPIEQARILDVIELLDERVDQKTPEVRALALVEQLQKGSRGKPQKEFKELRRLLERAVARGPGASGGDDEGILAALSTHELSDVLERHADRADGGRYPQTLSVTVDRRGAEFASWYEMWARSQGQVEGQPASFDDMIGRLDEIAEMGFDVLYLPPIHPIGVTHRKGPNNSLVCPPGSPGCPYAIGNEHGGHTAIDPELGTIDDFDRFVAACEERGMEVALDYALQASPDHPWVEAHPEWFLHRPDGSIKYAENPPKKYQDVYPLNFATEDREGLWRACLEVLEFWIAHGVKTFRVDNPHTKPVQFWDWLIAEVQREHPEVVFLAEAFTRPKMMQGLAKSGFTQSYTYFTWRNFKREIIEYFEELTQSEVAEHLRANLFVNTPDILPKMLQNAPRSAFMMRATLATTLSSVWGMYNGFELCEGTPVPGKEEYLNSEKYDYKVWDWDRPGNIKAYIAKLNAARHSQPALQRYRDVRFCETENEQVLAYYKATDDLRNIVVTVVNLDPYRAQETMLTLPLEQLKLGPQDTYQMHDLVSDERFIWSGASNYVKLDPEARVAHVFRLLRWSHREHDFDYFI
jgi:starch synthase (maltosyl-transferring)